MWSSTTLPLPLALLYKLAKDTTSHGMVAYMNEWVASQAGGRLRPALLDIRGCIHVMGNGQGSLGLDLQLYLWRRQRETSLNCVEA